MKTTYAFTIAAHNKANHVYFFTAYADQEVSVITVSLLQWIHSIDLTEPERDNLVTDILAQAEVQTLTEFVTHHC